MENSPVYMRKLDQINSLIRDLYEFDLDNYSRYTHYLKELQEIIYFDYGNVVFYWKDNDNYNLEFFCQIGWPDETEKLYVTKYYRDDDVFPIFARKTPVIMKSSDMFDDSRDVSQYYLDFMVPAGFDRSLECNIILPVNVNCYGICSLFRTNNKQNFVLEEEKVLEIIQPHLSKAATVSWDKKESIKNDITQHSAISYSIVFKESGEILTVDESLKQILSNEDSNYNVQAIVESIIDGVGNKEHNEYCFSIPNTSMLIEIMFNQDDRSIYSCIVYNMSKLSQVCIKNAQEKHDLTAKETEIMEYSLKGISRQEMAEKLLISVPTVKKYISSIYRKMDINSHAQLMKKIGIL